MNANSGYSSGNIRLFFYYRLLSKAAHYRLLSKAETSVGCSTIVDFNASKDGELKILGVGNLEKMCKFYKVYASKGNQGAQI